MVEFNISLVNCHLDELFHHLELLRKQLPGNFEDRYNSLRAIEQWLYAFKGEIADFVELPF